MHIPRRRGGNDLSARQSGVSLRNKAHVMWTQQRGLHVGCMQGLPQEITLRAKEARPVENTRGGAQAKGRTRGCSQSTNSGAQKLPAEIKGNRENLGPLFSWRRTRVWGARAGRDPGRCHFGGERSR